MEKEFKKELKGLRKQVQAILKSLGDSSLDWTIQISLNSIEPDKVKYCCMIHIPTEGVAPITWVCDSLLELQTKLNKAAKDLNPDMVQIAWHQGELKKIDSMKQYHERAIEELMDKHES